MTNLTSSKLNPPASELAAARYRDNALGVLLFLLVDDYESRFLAAYRKLGFDDVLRSHGAVMRHLDSSCASISELSLRAGITKQTIGKIVRQLECLGYLSVVTSSEDRRARIVRFSLRGERLVSASNRVVDEIRKHYRQRLGEQIFIRLNQLLDAVTAELGVQPRSHSSGDAQRFLHFGRLLVELACDFERRLHAQLSATSARRISRPGLTQLYHLGAGGVTISELAEAQLLTVQAVSLTVRQLAVQSLVAVRECSGDSRAKRVRLGESGIQFMHELADACTSVRGYYAQLLGADELAELENTIKKLQLAL
jgi:DNA-binding MarR family transcriptional regulator